MKVGTIIGLSSCVTGCFVLVILLYLNSYSPLAGPQNFNRTVRRETLTEAGAIDIKYNSYYIAGLSGNRIYLGNYMAPLHLLEATTSLADTQFITVSLDPISSIKPGNTSVQVEGDHFYMMDGNGPALWTGRIHEWTAKNTLRDSIFYLKAIPLDSGSFAFLGLGKTHENVLGKLTLTWPYVKLSSNVLEKQRDGIFCTYGTLHFDKILKQVLFVYMFRNEYFVMDTSMALRTRRKTIDPISNVQIIPARIRSENAYTTASPLVPINKSSCTSDGMLYINSAVMSQNENELEFKRSSVIDVYGLASGKYAYSFYVPNFKELKMKQFLVVDHSLFAIYDHHLVRYEMHSVGQ